ncbi:hypothetical protein [Aliarcobacter butzleri]|uniref:hypothetical protein n=1 Tax=Aliarcobacter butzleri TaxID=28197 RepID=UPI0012FC99E9|nr:hypothetical protein [Aliarcobacter butzleri]
MTQSEVMATLLEISENSYYRWKKKDHIRLVNLIEKYFTIKDLEEFLETEKISRLENNRDQELLNNEASKIYNHFISVLYLKDKSLLKLFLVVINNANETSANLNLNFIDLVFESKGSKKDKINLLKEFNKTVQNNNILFFYSIKFMIQNKFENILYAFGDNKIAKDLSFIVNYIQFFLEIFYKKDYIKWQEFEKNESIHLRDYEFNLDDEIFLDEQSDSPLPSLDDLSDENKIPNYDYDDYDDYDDYYNEYEEESNNYDNFNYFKFIDSLKNYKTYLESLIPENDTILVKFKIDENPDIDLEELLTIKNSFDI